MVKRKRNPTIATLVRTLRGSKICGNRKWRSGIGKQLDVQVDERRRNPVCLVQVFFFFQHCFIFLYYCCLFCSHFSFFIYRLSKESSTNPLGDLSLFPPHLPCDNANLNFIIRRSLSSLGLHVNKFIFSSIQGSVDLDYMNCFALELVQQKEKLTLNRSFAALKKVRSKLTEFISKFDEYVCSEIGKKNWKQSQQQKK